MDNLLKRIKNVLINEVGEPRTKSGYDFKAIHDIQIIDTPAEEDPKHSDKAPNPKPPKGQGATSVKYDPSEKTFEDVIKDIMLNK